MQAGDVVRLKSDYNQKMTVRSTTRAGDERILCIWFTDDGSLHDDYFYEAELHNETQAEANAAAARARMSTSGGM